MFDSIVSFFYSCISLVISPVVSFVKIVVDIVYSTPWKPNFHPSTPESADTPVVTASDEGISANGPDLPDNGNDTPVVTRTEPNFPLPPVYPEGDDNPILTGADPDFPLPPEIIPPSPEDDIFIFTNSTPPSPEAPNSPEFSPENPFHRVDEEFGKPVGGSENPFHGVDEEFGKPVGGSENPFHGVDEEFGKPVGGGVDENFKNPHHGLGKEPEGSYHGVDDGLLQLIQSQPMINEYHDIA